MTLGTVCKVSVMTALWSFCFLGEHGCQILMEAHDSRKVSQWSRRRAEVPWCVGQCGGRCLGVWTTLRSGPCKGI